MGKLEPTITKREGLKAENLGFGCLGNGTTVWDRTRERNRDYLIVAHISEDGRVVTYYAQISHEQHEHIKSQAQAIRETKGG